jgi:hypothetical protein
VEVAVTDSAILVRDSKDLRVPHLTFEPTAWDQFLKGVENGEFQPK